MILHIVTDEKFTDYAIKQFYNTESKFVLIPSNNNLLHLVKNIEKVNIIQNNSKEFNDLLTNICIYKSIILHGTHWGNFQATILLNIPKDVKVAWVIWGGDLLGRSDIKDNFLAPCTRLLNWLHSLKKYKKSTKLEYPNWEIPYNLFSRIDYCLTSQKELFDYSSLHFNKKFEYLWYTYYNIEEIIGSLFNSRTSGNNIWLGNSATPTNNHIDTLLSLYKYQAYLKGKKIYIPLSYPNTWIRNIVKKIGGILYKKSIIPLETFVEREKYNQLMLDCSVMIMPHYMSQAMGNIYTGLWLGMRVYMSKKNISYNYLKRIGIKVFTIEDDLSKYKFSKLTEEEILYNRSILLKEYGINRIKESIKEIISTLNC